MNLKVVVPLASPGLSMLPASKSVPWEMLPLADMPFIQYLINEIASAGFRDVIFISHADKYPVRDHFDLSYELESQLEQKNKFSLLSLVRRLCPQGMSITCVTDHGYLGDGHALIRAKSAIGDAPFIVVLPRFLMVAEENCQLKNGLSDLADRFTFTGRNQLQVIKTDSTEETQHFRTIITSKTLDTSGDTALITGIASCAEGAKSSIISTGRFVLTPHVWDVLEKTQPNAYGEVTLFDALCELVKAENSDAVLTEDRCYDCASKIGYMKAFVEYSLRHSDEGMKLRQIIMGKLSG
ncbi:TPA: GalU regulator GalF [Citrobacter freundii]|nr:GalU regulator GalF [Citrobacter freundii]